MFFVKRKRKRRNETFFWRKKKTFLFEKLWDFSITLFACDKRGHKVCWNRRHAAYANRSRNTFFARCAQMRTDRERAAATMRTINYGRDRHTAPNPRHSRRSWSRLKPHTAGSDWRSIRVSGNKSAACDCAIKQCKIAYEISTSFIWERKLFLRITRNEINTFVAFLF